MSSSSSSSSSSSRASSWTPPITSSSLSSSTSEPSLSERVHQLSSRFSELKQELGRDGMMREALFKFSITAKYLRQYRRLSREIVEQKKIIEKLEKDSSVDPNEIEVEKNHLECQIEQLIRVVRKIDRCLSKVNTFSNRPETLAELHRIAQQVEELAGQQEDMRILKKDCIRDEHSEESTIIIDLAVADILIEQLKKKQQTAVVDKANTQIYADARKFMSEPMERYPAFPFKTTDIAAVSAPTFRMVTMWAEIFKESSLEIQKKRKEFKELLQKKDSAKNRREQEKIQTKLNKIEKEIATLRGEKVFFEEGVSIEKNRPSPEEDAPSSSMSSISPPEFNCALIYGIAVLPLFSQLVAELDTRREKSTQNLINNILKGELPGRHDLYEFQQEVQRWKQNSWFDPKTHVEVCTHQVPQGQWNEFESYQESIRNYKTPLLIKKFLGLFSKPPETRKSSLFSKVKNVGVNVVTKVTTSLALPLIIEHIDSSWRKTQDSDESLKKGRPPEVEAIIALINAHVKGKDVRNLATILESIDLITHLEKNLIEGGVPTEQFEVEFNILRDRILESGLSLAFHLITTLKRNEGLNEMFHVFLNKGTRFAQEMITSGCIDDQLLVRFNTEVVEPTITCLQSKSSSSSSSSSSSA